MSTRRQFITLVGGAAAWPLAARAQPAKKTPRVGVLWHAGSAEEESIYLGAFLEGLTGPWLHRRQDHFSRTALSQ
jgi:putative ABC transport system substrate-binding protein